MPSFREKLLTEVTGICQQLYERRLALVKTQALVSESAKQDVIKLVVRLNRLREITPFPSEQYTDMTTLKKLKTDIAAADGDQFAVQKVSPDYEEQEATSPINQRMIDDLATFRAKIDSTRLNLMMKGDSPDLEAYTAARNAFTLSRAVYDERLKLNQISATNADCSQMEQVLIPAVRDATGATFPGAIQAGADFISNKLFV